MTAANPQESLAYALSSQCSDLTKHLADKGMGFKLLLKIKTFDFEFSVGTTKPSFPGVVPMDKKKKSPSTLRRNEERSRKFRAKKQEAGSGSATAQEAGVNPFPCDVCGLRFRNKRGLSSHKRVHKVPNQELVRQPANDSVDSLDVSGADGVEERAGCEVLSEQLEGQQQQQSPETLRELEREPADELEISLDSRDGSKPKGGVAQEDPELQDESEQQHDSWNETADQSEHEERDGDDSESGHETSEATQTVDVCEEWQKEGKLAKLLDEIESEQGAKILILVETKRKADKLTSQMRKDGWPALRIHGDTQQKERDWVLGEFRQGQTSILVATDVAAARWLDVDDIKFVINYDNGDESDDLDYREVIDDYHYSVL